MAAPNYTYTITNGNAADGSQVMQNFNDILNGVTDGTKDLSINALTCAGAVTFNGNVTLGNASGDDVTITGSLAASVPVKTQYSFDIGSATAGLRSIYFGSSDGAARGTRLIGGTVSADRTVTLPTSAGTLALTFASSQVVCDSPNGHGSTNTRIRRFTNATTTGTDITYADSATNGASFTINTAGVYVITYTDNYTAGFTNHGISLNSANLTTSVQSLSASERLIMTSSPSANVFGSVSICVRLAASDVIRPHTAGQNDLTASTGQFRIVRIV